MIRQVLAISNEEIEREREEKSFRIIHELRAVYSIRCAFF